MKLSLRFSPQTQVCDVIQGEAAFPLLHGLTAGREAFVFTDETVLSFYREEIGALGVPCFAMQAGEEHKSQDTLFSLLGEMAKARLHRGALLIALGGGVVGDIGGLAASLYMRGIEVCQVPTTLLAQADASIGGKTAIDFFGVKNLIGAFKQPRYIVADPAFFKTLPLREVRCGAGEIVKHGALDGELFDVLWENRTRILEREFLAGTIPQNIACKAKIVQEDPEEKSVRKLLNLGHTTGHAVELTTTLSHGEAVMIGLIYEAELAKRHCRCNEGYLARLQSLARAVLLHDPKEVDLAAALPRAMYDKKNAGSGVTVVAPVERGKAEILELPYGEYAAELLKIREGLS